MASLFVAALAFTLATTSTAAPALTERNCINLQLSVPVTANTTNLDVPRVDNNVDAVDLVWNIERWTAPNTTARITGTNLIQQTFSINAQLCVPNNSTKNVLQIATHGFGFEKRYWDSELHPELYSYVEASLAAGYSILTYDRLGVGRSDKPDAYDIVQGSVQVEIIKELTLMARAGSLTTSSSIQNTAIPKFDKIVLVGHSLGSALTLGVLTKYGNLVEGAVSTGFIIEGVTGLVSDDAFGLEYAASNDPQRFSDRGSGYMVQATQSNAQQIFFKKGHFEQEMLEYAVSIKETGTVGDFVSLGLVLGQPALEFTGPLLFALGEYDYAICNGNCTGFYDLPALKSSLFPNATDLTAHVQPGSGHALTMHTNATGQFQAIFKYLESNGL
ncbi:uncharacterized protein LY89DRAFT_765843 [Mollisia scopiformis]|uniref:AB hydrolase-1 domain-containing protein n=1 Tax=Mollisia scopiformis TaxID=149040 RepID=A0A132B5V6_MOLSC|nr:uncharacterized protein LY89DRAFT_765843 [Mollisia scopiformis]KUJ07790.1 hypothetical protein LY89DRAFT_765843 [Mollisia scopiformis]